VFGLSDLAKIVFGKNDNVFLLGGVQRGVADVQQICPQRQVRPVLFEDSERKQAGSLRAADAFTEVGGGEFFPMDRELGVLRMAENWCEGSRADRSKRKSAGAERLLARRNMIRYASGGEF
jgi:hypothetical protein